MKNIANDKFNDNSRKTLVHRGNKFKIPCYTLEEEGGGKEGGLGWKRVRGGLMTQIIDRIITFSITKKDLTEKNLFKSLYLYIESFIQFDHFSFIFLKLVAAVEQIRFEFLNHLFLNWV